MWGATKSAGEHECWKQKHRFASEGSMGRPGPGRERQEHLQLAPEEPTNAPIMRRLYIKRSGMAAHGRTPECMGLHMDTQRSVARVFSICLERGRRRGGELKELGK